MRIVIDNKYIPYSDRPGTRVLLPGTSVELRVYPSRVVIKDLLSSAEERVFEYPNIDRGFAVFQDIEHLRILIRGFSGSQAVQKEICVQEGQCILKQKKPEKSFFVLLEEIKKEQKASCAKIHFGCYKKPNMTRMRSQVLIEEYLPFWHALGKHYEQSFSDEKDADTTALLDEIEKTIKQRDLQSLSMLWNRAFLSCVKDLFVPTRFDDEYHGFVKQTKSEKNPLEILTRARILIEKMLLEEKKGCVSLGRGIPPELHCGRAERLHSSLGFISCEWSKKQMKKVKIEAFSDASAFLEMPKVKSLRLRTGAREKGKRIELQKPIVFEKGKTYFLDQMMR